MLLLSDERWRAIWAARRDEILGSELILHTGVVKEEREEEEDGGDGTTGKEKKCPVVCGEDWCGWGCGGVWVSGGGVIIVDEDSGAAVVGRGNLDSGAEPAIPRLCDDHCWCWCWCCSSTCGDGSLGAASVRSFKALNTDGMRNKKDENTNALLLCSRG